MDVSDLIINVMQETNHKFHHYYQRTMIRIMIMKVEIWKFMVWQYPITNSKTTKHNSSKVLHRTVIYSVASAAVEEVLLHNRDFSAFSSYTRGTQQGCRRACRLCQQQTFFPKSNLQPVLVIKWLFSG